ILFSKLSCLYSLNNHLHSVKYMSKLVSPTTPQIDIKLDTNLFGLSRARNVLIPTKQVPSIYFLSYTFNLIIQTIGYDDVTFFFEDIKLIHNKYTFEFRFFQTWLIDNYFYILLF